MKSLLISAAAMASANAEIFIVKLKDSDQGSVSGVIARHPNIAVEQTFSIGEEFSALAVEAEDISELEADEAVEYVSENAEFELFVPVPDDDVEVQADSWGIDRINQRSLPLDNNYSPWRRGGVGVTAYIIDSGVQTDHPQFEGRARFGFNGVGGTNADTVGHGTHVAGTVAARDFGVAPEADIVAVKVCATNSCSLQGILSGVEFAANDSRGKKAVANMSLGGGVNNAIDDAVRSAIRSGLQIAIASGNSNRDACSFSPARVAEAVTVNASTRSDGRASFSNFGRCTDVFAPGDGITSTWLRGGTNTISGTSMAAPHVCGVMALYLAESNYTPAQLQDAIISSSTPNRISNAGSGSPNRLVYYAPENSGENPTNPPVGPPVDPPCSGLCCLFPVFC